MRPSQRRRLRIGAAAVVVLAAVGATVGFTRGSGSHGYDGTVIAPALSRPTTVLTDTSGKPFSLAHPDGKATLVYFGYTHCPDVCPATMADIHQALEHVSAAERAKVRVVFVTVDPEHDPASRIKTWLANFDPSFIGLTGAYSDILSLGNALLAGVSNTPPKTVDGKTVVEHGSTLVGLTPSGNAPVAYIPSTPGSSQGPDLQKEIEHDLPMLEAGVGA